MSAAHSRGRARADAPSVTYVRMALQVSDVSSSSLAAGRYVLRWMRGGKHVKSTQPHPLPGPLSDKLSLYARVRRPGGGAPCFVPEDPSVETLATQIALVRVPEGSAVVPLDAPFATAVEFDVGEVLHEIVQSRVKTIPTSLRLPPDVVVTTTVTIKVIGESHLAPLEEAPPEVAPPEMSSLAAPSLSPVGSLGDNDEALAARELERLRQEVREREGRVAALSRSTDALDAAVQQHAKVAESAVPAAEVAALTVRLQTMEHQRQEVEKEKAELERKVAAHVSHAATIKSTYNQLAAWYNNLRNEHAELQQKHPETAAEQSPRGELPQDVSTTLEADLRSLERERNELQLLLKKERSEKKSIYSRNSELMESKARTMAELRTQWENARNALTTSTKTTEQQGKQVSDLQNAVNSLQAHLAEKENELNQRSIAMDKLSEEARELAARHAQEIEQTKSELLAKASSTSGNEMAELKMLHEKEVQKLVEDAEAARVAAVEAERTTLQRARDDELSQLRLDIEKQADAKRREEVAQLQEQFEKEIQAKTEASQKILTETKTTARSLDEKTLESARVVAALQEQLESLAQESEERAAEHAKVVESVEERHRKELEEIQKSREDAEHERAVLEEKLNGTANVVVERETELNSQVTALEKELATAHSELKSLRSANGKLKDFSQQAAVAGDERESLVADLEKEVDELTSLIRVETEKRNETRRLLAAADNEHDELRAMVSRLRSERDEALKEAEHAREGVPNPKVSIGAAHGRGQTGDDDEDKRSLLDERDKAIRELFRVRKGMNKEIKQLKMENLDLSNQLDVARGDSDELRSRNHIVGPGGNSLEAFEEGKLAISELHLLRRALMSYAGDGNSKDGNLSAKEVASDINLEITALTEEINSRKAEADKLNSSLLEATAQHREEVEKINSEKKKLYDELERARRIAAESAANVEKMGSDIASVSTAFESSKCSVETLTQSRDEACTERDDTRRKSEALVAELHSLKKSIELASSSSSSTEKLLHNAQSELADSKRVSAQLQSELETSQSKCKMMKDEISRLEEAANSNQAVSLELSEKVQMLEKSLAGTQLRLEVVTGEKEREIAQVTVLVEKLRSEASLRTAELAAEKSIREEAQKNLNTFEKRIGDLESELSTAQASDQAKAKLISKLTAEKEEVQLSLSDMKKRLDASEACIAEREVELSSTRDGLMRAEASHDRLQKQSSEAGDATEAASARIADLQAELKQKQDTLDITTKALDSAREKAAEMNKGAQVSSRGIAAQEDATTAKLVAVESRLERTEDELRVIKESYSTLEDVLEKVQQKSAKLSRVASERAKEIGSLRSQLAGTAADQTVRADYEALAKEHAETRHELLGVQGQISKLSDEKLELSERVVEMLAELGSMRERISIMQEENEEMLAVERSQTEKEVNKTIEMRKQLRAARAAADVLQSEAEQLRANNMELIQESEASKEIVASRDQEVLNDLISTRMELAYAQEETIQLRNKLKKVTQNGQGSSSIES